jgi:hypothetical protein
VIERHEATETTLAAVRAPRIGGSFAPPLDATKVVAYRRLADSAPPQIREAVHKLADMAVLFQETPRSSLPGAPHPVGRGVIVPLEKAEVERIWDAVPWAEEIEMYAALFDKIDPVTAKSLRDAAYHLLWFAVELEKDREPITNDML